MPHALTLAFCLLLSGLAGAADFPYRGDESYEGKVPAPGEFLGVPLGDRFTPHHDVMRYCRAVADASPRAQLVEYGRTVEGRELVLLLISSEQNLARLDDIQKLQQKLADPRRLAKGESIDSLLPRPRAAHDRAPSRRPLVSSGRQDTRYGGRWRSHGSSTRPRPRARRRGSMGGNS